MIGPPDGERTHALQGSHQWELPRTRAHHMPNASSICFGVAEVSADVAGARDSTGIAQGSKPAGGAARAQSGWVDGVFAGGRGRAAQQADAHRSSIGSVLAHSHGQRGVRH